MFEGNPQPMWMYDRSSLRFLAVNNSAIHLYGYSRDEFLAMTIKDIRPAEDVSALVQAVSAVTDGFTPPQGWRHRKKNGAIIQVEITSHTIDFEGQPAELVMARDLTARLQAEARVRHLNRVYAVLSDINQTIVREKDPAALLDDACRIAVGTGGFLMAWIGIADSQSGALRITAHAGADADTLSILQALIDEDPPAGCVFTRDAWQTGECRVCSHISLHPQAIGWREPALARGYQSMAAFPLRAGRDLVGVFNLYAGEPGFFDHDEVSLLSELAVDISFALDVGRRETARRAAEVRSARQREALIALASQRVSPGGAQVQELRQILEVAADTLAVARVSVWRFDPQRTAIECLDLFDAVSGQHSSGAILEARTHPSYFAALVNEEIIGADDALTDPRTAEFLDDYLRPVGIGAMLDVPTTVDGVRDGVLCHEHLGGARIWTEDEKTFAVAIGNLVSLTLERDSRRHAEERFRELAETIEEVFWITDAEKGRMLYISPAFEKIWERSCQSGYDEPSSWFEAVHSDDRDRVIRAATTKRITGEYDEEYRIIRPDGTLRWIRDQAFPVRNADGRVLRIVGVARDITERRDLERQFRQAQKMEAVGQLAGGVAHDFNNILTAIQFNASLLQSTEGVPGEAHECARDIEHAVQRAAGLTRQLLTFSRKQVMQARNLDLNIIVADMTTMLRRIIGEDVVVDVRYAADVLPVHADPGMIEQVIMNLAVNARDAMPTGGIVSIETTSARVHGVRHARLSVQDSGIGMAPEVRARIFEPFFTTKGAGSGTGLGLAMVHGIVEQHRGYIEVDSTPNHGTTIDVYIPCLPSTTTTEALTATPQPPQTTDGGGRQILVVEDERSVRQLVRTVLMRAGYRVLVAEHGVAALAQWAAHKDTIALVMTDIVMPEGMTGVDLARAIHQEAPACPLLFTSGYAPEAVTQQVDLTEGVNFLAKPLTAARLLSVVGQMLSNP
jgi:PAS domain S-box-containing protein